jgi:hypothetical protein
MFVMFVHTGEEPVHRLLVKMSNITDHLKSPTFLVKIVELVSRNSYGNLCIVKELESSTSIFNVYSK